VPVSLGERLAGLIRDGLPQDQTIGVALSGGGDSTALLHLCLAAGMRVEAVTVDHRLRPESADEATAVARACAALGVPHATMVWKHGPVTGNLMDRARRARMALIADWARARGIRVVALGHTQDDQAETVLMGLSRAAGIAGLSGMRKGFDLGGVQFLRPLLAAGRKDLRVWLRENKVGWIDDPSNENERFARIRARKALAALAPLGISAISLAEVAGHLAQAQEALAVQVRAAAGTLLEVAGALEVDAGLWLEPVEVQRQLVVAALFWLTGAGYAPRSADVVRLITAMSEGRDATLAGCRFSKGWLMREPRAVGGPVAAGGLWDGRWQVTGAEGEVRALGADGLRHCPDWRATGLTRQVLEVTPGLWQGDRLIAAPLAGFGAATARCNVSFNAFLLSH
jgi:tRNA(Ile)-lysidine synthase